MEKKQPRKQKKCRAYISKDAQIKALKDRIKELERNIEQFEMELR